MKKVMTVILSLLIIMTFAACGSTTDEQLQQPAEVSGIEESAEIEESGEEELEQPAEQGQKTSGRKDTIPETVLLDESGVRITAKSLDFDAAVGPELKLLIENNSGTDLTVQTRKTSVNGCMVDTMMSVDVADGKQANDTLTFMGTDLELSGVRIIADMEFSFHIFTSSDWETYLDTPQICLMTSAAENYEYIYDDSGASAYEGEDVRVVVKGLTDTESIFGPSVVVYMENNGQRDLTIQTRNVSVNGYMVDAIFSSEISAGKRAVDTITFLSSDLEENEITQIESVELSLHIFDSETWDTITDTDAVTITF